MSEDLKQNMSENMPEATDNQEIIDNEAQPEKEPQTPKKKKGFFSRSSNEEAKNDKPDQQKEQSDAGDVEKPVVEEIDPINDLEQKLAEANDKFLRLFSDFDNFRKRTARERLDMAKSASSDLIVQLIPVVDDFERALKSMDGDNEATLPIRQGVELIYSKLWSILERQGVKPIDAIGKEFDTDFHEALTKIPTPDEAMKGKVIDQVEKGYTLGEKVIRFSKVVVGA